MAHRQLIGVDSPPDDYTEDRMTDGPRLPEGWTGDAWTRQDANGSSYWLRAWNKTTGQYAVARADKYEAARLVLQKKISQGGTGKAEITSTTNWP